jgi:hypothetical protein
MTPIWLLIFIPALGPTQPPAQSLTSALFPWVKWSSYECEELYLHSSIRLQGVVLSSVQDKSSWRYLVGPRDNFMFLTLIWLCYEWNVDKLGKWIDKIEKKDSELPVEVFCVLTPCSVVVGYHNFRGPCCLRQDPPKRWYRTTTLHGVTIPEGLDLKCVHTNLPTYFMVQDILWNW